MATRRILVDHMTRERFSVQAWITYALIILFALVVTAVFGLIVFRVPVSDTLLGVLGGLILTVSNLVAGAVGYWLGSTASSNRVVQAVPAPPRK